MKPNSTSIYNSHLRRINQQGNIFMLAIGVFLGFALIIFLFGGFLIYLRENAKREEAELRRLIPVVSAAVDLPAGTVITTQDIMLKQAISNSIEPGVFKDLRDPALIGGTLKIEVLGGQTILRSYIGSPEQKQ